MHVFHRNKNGSSSLRHIASGEVMHSSIGPLAESQLLYIEQSRLAERLAAGERLCAWDVGLGAATNALGAVRCALQVPAARLDLISFESDLSGLALAFENKQELPYLEEFAQWIEKILAAWARDPLTPLRLEISNRVAWTVYPGDFREHAPRAPKADLVYFDFYSPKSAPELWCAEIFKLLRAGAGESCEVFTYSSATRVRAALLKAGWFVGQGRATGAKNQTTVAATKRALLKEALDGKWLDKIPRSGAFSEEERAVLFTELSQHPQFKN